MIHDKAEAVCGGDYLVARVSPRSTNTVAGLSTTYTIVAIARDSALLRSLAFALQAHGYRVTPFRSWKSAELAAAEAGCVILDECLPAEDREACLKLLGNGMGVVLLGEDDTFYAERSGLRVLHKPLSGSDVVAAVTAIRRNP